MKVWESPQKEDIPASLEDFLKKLAGPTVIKLPVPDSHKTRILVTLSHGNEPSGVHAVHQWLLTGRNPNVNIVIIIGSVEAALTAPLFFHRQLPDNRDLNRCFSPPYPDQQGRLALAILEYIRNSRAEAVVDMHNTSGTSGPFAVTFNHNHKKEALASLFVEHLIVSKIRLGALMEQEQDIPIITLEAGGAQDPASPIMALRSLEKYFLTDDLFSHPLPIARFEDPLRLELNSPEQTLDYADRPLPKKDITIWNNLESFSFTLVGEENSLGWLSGEVAHHFRIRQNERAHPADDFFQRDSDGIFRPKRKMRLFMATNRPDIATSDCLFYFICVE